ncbi:hypothetical protein KUG47_14075 [Falsochrobactrum sp. TDYN1]|uniref:DUF883 domain-containing protein n=1 Tax=Falsochrobactrum tianjinense TaxID=2706015 RepID=A0A949PNZ5_9HYPH|nr:hypothetical protein [Falsochrobactrum sp. TDYN1]MBV2144623.1 hypothetical protein [Falsochrobactrum sp. TDYN1]
MADNKTANDIQQALEQQIADMRGELKRLSQSLASHSGDLRDRAEDVMDDASGRIRHAAQTVRERGQAVAETVKENPGTATTLFGTAGILGILIGVAIGCAISDRR